jgi:hypothetical protein
VWVFVDGQLVYEKKQVLESQSFEIDIELAPDARFLTFVVTDGGSNDEAIVQQFKERYGMNKEVTNSKQDMFFFARPQLVLSSE